MGKGSECIYKQKYILRQTFHYGIRTKSDSILIQSLSILLIQLREDLLHDEAVVGGLARQDWGSHEGQGGVDPHQPHGSMVGKGSVCKA